jgi:TonB-linked SusC/RagA family outer membrane protein
MKRLALWLTCLFVGMGLAIAQSKSVSGSVVDEAGDPVIGVSIVVKGNTLVGTVTDLNGKFTLSVPESATTLVVKYLGMADQEIAVAPTVSVTLHPSDSKLDEVIVIAYGTTKREGRTGAIASVTSKEIADIPATSVDKMLSGKMAGVSVTSQTGQPGSNTSIRIRGTSSINASNQPLYIVDGVAVMTGHQDVFTNTSNALSMLNPNDIENITVLKDAAAASVYGSRAANGVILITTKSGRDGTNRFTARAKYGVSSLANDNDYNVMNPSELLSYYRQAAINAGYNPDAPAITQANGSQRSNPYYFPQSLLALPQTNWMDHFTRLGQQQEYEITASGGNARTQTYNSVSYQRSQGVYYGIDYKRFQARSNVDHEINRKLKFGTRTNVGYVEGSDVAMQNLYYANPAFAGLTIRPWTAAYDENGKHNINIPENANTNPRATAEYDEQWGKTIRFVGNQYLEWKPIAGLTLKTNNAAEFAVLEGRRYWAPEANDGEVTLQTSQDLYYRLTTSNTASYDRVIDTHTFRILAGQEAISNNAWEMYEYSTGLNPKIPHHVGGNSTNDIEYVTEASSLLSFFGIVDYNYDGKYYFQSSLRYDGSSKFGANRKYGWFYSVGGSWNINRESFLSQVDAIELLKLRASYGVNGNEGILPYRQYGLYSSTSYNGVTGLRPTRPLNNDLSWEKNLTWNAGVDFNFLKNYSGSIDVYSRKTVDMLLDKPVSSTSGFTSAFQNVGSMKNDGVEFQFDAKILDTSDWQWDAGFNLAYNKTEILELAGDKTMDYSADSRIKHVVGKSMYTFYLVDYYGVNPVNGEALWRTEKGEITNDYSKAGYIYAGSPEPKFIGGLNTSVSYKGIALSALLEYKFGNKVLIVENRYLQSDGNQMTLNQSKSALNYWKQPGDTGVNPKPVAGNTSNSYNYSSDRFLEKGDYTRIKDVTLSYTLPTKTIKKAGLSNLRIYASGLNVFTFHDVNFWDPERGADGMGYGIYPVSKTFVLGLDLSF